MHHKVLSKAIISSVDKHVFISERGHALHIAAVLGFQNYRRKSGHFFNSKFAMKDAYNMIRNVLDKKCKNFAFNIG